MWPWEREGAVDAVAQPQLAVDVLPEGEEQRPRDDRRVPAAEDDVCDREPEGRRDAEADTAPDIGGPRALPPRAKKVEQ